MGPTTRIDRKRVNFLVVDQGTKTVNKRQYTMRQVTVHYCFSPSLRDKLSYSRSVEIKMIAFC